MSLNDRNKCLPEALQVFFCTYSLQEAPHYHWWRRRRLDDATPKSVKDDSTLSPGLDGSPRCPSPRSTTIPPSLESYPLLLGPFLLLPPLHLVRVVKACNFGLEVGRIRVILGDQSRRWYHSLFQTSLRCVFSPETGLSESWVDWTRLQRSG
ncbi:uncharacterized protein YALI1_A06815g [Yarrowia lipolytica]|jgi:hypothetical protein|uniref:Uncharacterized protein n=1 Tax=Yarrowia lipolytica TaxID=4952 RepID=A0A1D8N404_YARLL|nr:hypothetical protein YALI1_A06815g [Yarrowia lipolytica]